MEDTTLGDTVPDPAAGAALEGVERRDGIRRLSILLWAALDTLTEDERAVILAHHCYGHTWESIARERGENVRQVRKMGDRVMRELRCPRNSWALREYR